MSARRIERLPSGRSNVSNHSNNSSRPITAGANRPSTATAGCNSARGPENNRNNGIPPRPNSSRVPQHHSNNNSSRVNSSRDGVNSSRPNTAEPMLYSTRSDESCLSTVRHTDA